MNGTDNPKNNPRIVSESSRRERRAARIREQALSPMRIVMTLASLPLVAGGVALSLYVRTSPYEPSLAVAHLVARVGCDAAASVGLAPAYHGGPGYHARNDADDDGVACEVAGFGGEPAQDVVYTAPAPAPKAPARMVGGAKFVKPRISE